MLARIASAAVVITTRAGTCRSTSLNAALRPIPPLIPIISQDEIESSDDEPATSNPKTIRTGHHQDRSCEIQPEQSVFHTRNQTANQPQRHCGEEAHKQRDTDHNHRL